MTIRHKMAVVLTAAMAAPAMLVSAVAREPAASSDSEPAVLDTRIGSFAVVEERTLDSRAGSWAGSNLRGLNTTKMGTRLIIR